MASSSGGGGGGGNKELYRSIAEQKLKAFSIGSMGKRGVSRKEQEELKKRQDEEEVGKVYQEFVSTFEDAPSSKVNKTWVKAGTFNAGNRKEDTSDRGQLYKPQSRIDLNKKEQHHVKVKNETRRPEKPGSKKKQTEKKKSNLEIFKEELKAIQEEREERHRIKGMVRGGGSFGSGSIGGQQDVTKETSAFLGDIQDKTGSHDTGDPNTTNLYLGHLSPRLTEQQLMELFGKYGPLASIKIMWPRTEDEKSRGRNCGFVAYMSRLDGERALNHLLGKDVDGFEMKMGWGKPVPIPLHPIYVPPAMLKLTLPPPHTGLPFNCQPTQEDAEYWGLDNGPIQRPAASGGPEEDDMDEYLRMCHRSYIKVVIPTDRTQLCLINRLVEFVVREGPMFEAMIMNREMNNVNFQFLFENTSPEHIYYRWRLFSMLQGDSKDDWNMEEFRMFKGGSVWKPPVKHLFTAGMPDHLFTTDDQVNKSSTDNQDGKKEDNNKNKRGGKEDNKESKPRNGLSNSQRDRFEDMLRRLIPDRNPIAEIMVWCIEHAEAGQEVVDCISESLSILQTPLTKKIARLYLISDILHNCSVKGVPNVSFYRKGFQAKLPEIFADLHLSYKSIESRIRAEAFKQRVLMCFRAWEDWALYPQDFLIRMQNIFLGLVSTAEEESEASPGKNNNGNDDVDGKSLSEDEDVDGIPLDGAALLKSAQKGGSSLVNRTRRQSNDSDVEMPTSSSLHKSSLAGRQMPPGFVPSKWETVDPEAVQAQAVTSKWDIFDQEDEASKKKDSEDDDDDIDGVPLQLDDDDAQLDFRLSEMRRARLREVELKVMCYQDELESGKQPQKAGWTISEQVEQYRKKLTRKAREAYMASAETENSRTPKSTGSGTLGSTPGRVDSRGGYDSDTQESSSRRGGSKKKGRRRRSSSSSRSRSRERKKSRRSDARRSPSSSSEEESRSSRSYKRSSSRRSRSRSPSSKKHKKKRH